MAPFGEAEGELVDQQLGAACGGIAQVAVGEEDDAAGGCGDLRQIRELWGDAIDDPDQRFEMLLVLRSQRLRGAPAQGEDQGAGGLRPG